MRGTHRRATRRKERGSCSGLERLRGAGSGAPEAFASPRAQSWSVLNSYLSSVTLSSAILEFFQKIFSPGGFTAGALGVSAIFRQRGAPLLHLRAGQRDDVLPQRTLLRGISDRLLRRRGKAARPGGL